jgi:hypothetical protein
MRQNLFTISKSRSLIFEYNWAYFDIFGEMDIVQDSFLFTLYLLKTFGKFRSKKFYADKFVSGFSHILEKISLQPLSL